MRQRLSPARVVLGILSGATLLAALVADFPTLSEGKLWSDGATYLAMASSLAEDGDLRYEAKDLARFEDLYAYGPHGLFLKKGSGVLYFAKSLIYPLVGAPFVRVFGGTRGLLVLNAVCFGLGVWLGYGELRRRGVGEWAALVVVLGLFVCGVGPLYVWWLTPEVFNFALITAGLVLWSRGWSLWSAVLLGVAIYSKPTNVFLAAAAAGGAARVASGAAGLLVSVKRGLVLSAATVALFGLNWAFTGELNYQGGERKTFYSRFPYETPETTFEAGGIWMTTEHVGPLVAGEDEGKEDGEDGTGAVGGGALGVVREEPRLFLGGPFRGSAAVFSGGGAGSGAFSRVGRTECRGLALSLSLGSSYVFFIWLIPDNWYGGGGTVGNRYFLNLLAARTVRPAAGPGVGGPGSPGRCWSGSGSWARCSLSPIRHSLHPGEHATAENLPHLPRRAHHAQRPLRLHRPLAEETAVPKLRASTSSTTGPSARSRHLAGTGFWLRGGVDAEVVLAAARPRAVELPVTGGPEGDIVTVRLGETAAGGRRDPEVRDRPHQAGEEAALFGRRLRACASTHGMAAAPARTSAPWARSSRSHYGLTRAGDQGTSGAEFSSAKRGGFKGGDQAPFAKEARSRIQFGEARGFQRGPTQAPFARFRCTRSIALVMRMLPRASVKLTVVVTFASWPPSGRL